MDNGRRAHGDTRTAGAGGSRLSSGASFKIWGASVCFYLLIEDNKLKHNKFIPGVKIPIKSKTQIKNKNNTLLVLAWNFYKDIKKNNLGLSDNFINIKELESSSWK